MTNEDDERKEAILVMNGKRYRNATQAADYLGISRSAFYKRGLDRMIPHEKLGALRRIYYAEEDLNRFR